MRVTLDVRFTLTDRDDHPLPDVPVRIVFGCDAGWHSADAGHRFVTDANGAHAFTADVVLDRRMRKPPTSFWSGLLSRSQPTDHLTIGTELEYMTFSWLYAADVHRFPGGDPVMLDGEAVYTRDAAGDFTIRARHDARGWWMTELAGMMLTTPGHELTGFQLQPDAQDPTGARWTLRLSYRRSPPPVTR
jgi:hypothetical protein